MWYCIILCFRNVLMSIFIFLICTSALESSPFVLFRFSCPVSLLYHIGFLKIDLKMVNANDSKFTQITLSLPKCSYKQRNLNMYSWSCHRIFVPEHFVNTLGHKKDGWEFLNRLTSYIISMTIRSRHDISSALSFRRQCRYPHL